MSEFIAISDQLMKAARAALLADDSSATVRLVALHDREQGMAVLVLPWAETKGFMDGTREYIVPLEVRCRHQDQGQAAMMAEKALMLLSDAAVFSSVTACTVSSAMPYSGPSELGGDAYGMHTYTADIQLDIRTI